MSIFVGTQLTEMITYSYKANISAIIMGGTGVGKSESVENAAKELGIGYLVIDLSLKEPSDLVGIPFIKGDRTCFAAPADLPREGKGIFMIEEINRAQPYMLAPTLQLLTARRLNDYVLPAGWVPMAAANPSNGQYAGTRQMDAALQARFMKIDVKPSKKNWLVWAEQHEIHPKVLEFVKATPEIFEPMESNPRAWTYVSKILYQFEAGGASSDLVFNGIAGFVGQVMASAFNSFFNQHAINEPTPEDYLKNYSAHRQVILNLVAANDTARLAAIIKEIILVVTDSNGRLSATLRKKWSKNLAALAKDLSGDFREHVEEVLKEFCNVI